MVCKNALEEPVIVITGADLMHQHAQEKGENFQVKKSCKLGKIILEAGRPQYPSELSLTSALRRHTRSLWTWRPP